MTDKIKKLEEQFGDLPMIRDNLTSLNSSLDKIKEALAVIERSERQHRKLSDAG